MSCRVTLSPWRNEIPFVNPVGIKIDFMLGLLAVLRQRISLRRAHLEWTGGHTDEGDAIPGRDPGLTDACTLGGRIGC